MHTCIHAYRQTSRPIDSLIGCLADCVSVGRNEVREQGEKRKGRKGEERKDEKKERTKERKKERKKGRKKGKERKGKKQRTCNYLKREDEKM